MKKKLHFVLVILLSLCVTFAFNGPVIASFNTSSQINNDNPQNSHHSAGTKAACQSLNHDGTITDEEPFWWQRWEACEWSSTQQAISSTSKNESLLLLEAPQDPKENRIPESTFQYPQSIRNSSEGSSDNTEWSTMETLGLWGDHGPTTGQPADRWNPALPKFPNFEGHWFPKQSHSKLYFSIWAESGINQLHIHIDRDQDTYTRYFYVRVDGQLIEDEIIGASGYENILSYYTSSAGYKEVELEIYYGGYKNHGWKLLYIWPYKGGKAQHILGEYFPKIYQAPLEYRIECGPDTKISLEIQRINDPYTRYFSIYIDGNLITQITVSGSNSYEFSLGTYEERSMHDLKLEIRSGSYVERGWRITLCALHYESVFVEVDWMGAVEGGCPGHKPPDSVLEYVEAYFKIHGYERVDMQFDEEIPHETVIQKEDFELIYVPAYFDHRYQLGWRYVLWGHFCYTNGFCIGYESWISDVLNLSEGMRRGILMHEFGHSVGIIEFWQFGEYYCLNQYCVMSVGGIISMYPWYCGHHWSLRQYPLYAHPGF